MEEAQVISEIIRLCIQIDEAFIRSHSEGEAVNHHNRHDLRKIGQALYDRGGIVLMRHIAKMVEAQPGGRYLKDAWDGIGGFPGKE